MRSADHDNSRLRTWTRSPRLRGLAALVAIALALTACVIESPSIEEAAPLPTSTVPLPTVELPSFVPTAPPVPTPAPTSTPEPTPEAPAPGDDVATLTVTIPSTDMAPTPQPPGLVAVPIAGTTTFRLAQPRPILQLPGHTLIYVDPDQEAEVDIFTPIATGDTTGLADFAAVVDEILTSATYGDLAELDSVSIAGFPTRVFEGNPVTGTRGFYADESTFGNESAGWYPPTRLRLWIIDTDNGPVAVTAESLIEPGQYNEAVRMAAGLLSSMTFG